MTERKEMMDKSKYMEMTELATEMLANVNIPAREDTVGDHIKEMVEEASGILKNNARGLRNTNENSTGVRTTVVAYDARFMAQAATVIKICAQAVDPNASTFDPSVFAENITNFMKESPIFKQSGLLDWGKLHREALKCAEPVPSFDYMLGTFDDADIPVKQRRAHDRSTKVACATKRPEIVNVIEKTEEGIEESVQIILKQLSRAYKHNAKKPVCYFTFAVDPQSFANTIENFFHLSFLIKDGFVQLSMDKNGLPVLTPRVHRKNTEPPTQEMDDGDNEQMIVSINMEEWENIIKTFKITSAMIKLPRSVPSSQSEPPPPMTNGHSRKRGRDEPSTSRE